MNDFDDALHESEVRAIEAIRAGFGKVRIVQSLEDRAAMLAEFGPRDTWIPHARWDDWVIVNRVTNEMHRTGRRKTHMPVWRTLVKSEAVAYAKLLNKEGKKERGELSSSQALHYIKQAARRQKRPRVIRNTFTKCGGCGNMVKADHACH